MTARSRFIVAMVSTTVISYFVFGSLLNRVLGDTTYGQLAVFNEVMKTVIDSYVDPIDIDDTMANAQRGLVEGLDGDSAYLPPAVYEAVKHDDGPDARIGVQLTKRFGFLMIAGVRRGSPADEAGLRAGDALKTIDRRHSRGLSPSEGELLLRGEPGSTVDLVVMRSGVEPFELTVARDRLVPQALTARLLEPRVAYAALTEFDAETAATLRRELEVLSRKGAERLVLDLRGAGFGDPEHGVAVADLFLAQGTIAKRAGRQVDDTSWEADADMPWPGPVVVLTDFGTSGPGEVVAAALVDAGRSETVGQHTFGRAPVQTLLPLPEGGLKLTIAAYYRPAGPPLHNRGVEPNVGVAPHHHEDDEDPVNSEDPILDAGLERLRQAETERRAA